MVIGYYRALWFTFVQCTHLQRSDFVRKSISLDYGISKMASGIIPDLQKAIGFLEVITEETSLQDVEAWALSECICPIVCQTLIAGGFDPSLEGYETLERLTYSYLADSEAVEFLEEQLGCSLSVATAADKLRVVTWRARSVNALKWGTGEPLESRQKFGANYVEYRSEIGACRECRYRDGKAMLIQDAIEFNREHNHGCTHEWITIDFEKESGCHIYTIDEMIQAGEPHGYRLISEIKALLKYADTPEKLDSLYNALYQSFLCFMSDNEKAATYRLMGELKLQIGDTFGALGDFKWALKHNPKVGVKRLCENLIKELPAPAQSVLTGKQVGGRDA